MLTYAILLNPGHNRVYFNTSRALAVCELTLTARRITASLSDIREETWGGIPYLAFNTEKPLTADDMTQLARLSFTYALFQVNENVTGASAPASVSLTPLHKDGMFYMSDGLSAMLKYTGKTNELFTRLMLNLAAVYGLFDGCEMPRVLDPVCGKGTTLFECLSMGWHASGVEIDEKLPHEAFVFLKKYLESARWKHESHTERVSGTADAVRFTATRYAVELAEDKQAQKEGRVLRAEIVAGDTRYVNTYFKKNSFHAIIGDLPYGVQHASRETKKPRNGFTRNALGLLSEALPEWVKVLKPGGVVVLAWNLFLIPRADMEALFITHGLILPTEEPLRQLAHRVDQAIERDVMVGVKPIPPTFPDK